MAIRQVLYNVTDTEGNITPESPRAMEFFVDLPANASKETERALSWAVAKEAIEAMLSDEQFKDYKIEYIATPY